MINQENLKKILPEIVTRIAINYPVAYINSISFYVKHKMVAACFWNEKNSAHETSCFEIMKNEQTGCFIYVANTEIQQAEVEITGTDEHGRDFLVSLPYQHLIRYSLAS